MLAAKMHRVAGFEVLEQKGRHGDDLGLEGLGRLREPFGVLLAREDRQIGIAAKLPSATWSGFAVRLPLSRHYVPLRRITRRPGRP